jgi:hypothetical protein
VDYERVAARMPSLIPRLPPILNLEEKSQSLASSDA